MTSITAAEASCRILTFKEGLLSRVAHDLELEVGTFSIDVDAGKVRAAFDTRSIRVLHAMHDGRPSPSTLSAKDRETIAANLQKDVLRQPRATFEGEVDASTLEVRGTLTLEGRARPISARGALSGTRIRFSIALQQPDYGITPYSAMLGALRVRAEVRIELDVPAPT